MSINNQVKSLTEAIEASHGTRTAAVSDLAKETRQTLGSFKQEHEKMAGDLRRFLASNRSGRASQVQKMRAENDKGLKDMIRDLAEFLSASEKERREEFAALRSELSSFRRNLSKAVDDMIADFSTDHRQARTHWQNLAKAMTAKRAGNQSLHQRQRGAHR